MIFLKKALLKSLLLEIVHKHIVTNYKKRF